MHAPITHTGTPPQAGIDVEPNHVKPGRSIEQLYDITLEDIECRQNIGSGLSLVVGKLATVAELNVTVNNLVVEGAVGAASVDLKGLTELTESESQRRLRLRADDDTLVDNIGILITGRAQPNTTSPGFLTLNNVSVTNTAQPGFEVYGKLATGAATTLRDVRLAKVAQAPTLRWGGANAPIVFHQSAPNSPVGSVYFDNCHVADTQARPFLVCDSCDSRGNATNISGSVVVHNPNSAGGTGIACQPHFGSHPQNVSLEVVCQNQTETKRVGRE